MMPTLASISSVLYFLFSCIPFTTALSLTSDQVACINRSRTTFLTSSSIGSGFLIPETPGIEITATLSGSFSFYGVLAEEIENTVETLAKESSKSVHLFYQSEKSRLQTKAAGLYFTWFQAAALFGFTNSTKTERILQSKAYRSFSASVGKYLDELQLGTYQAKYGVRLHIVSGRRGFVRGYTIVSELSLKSGRKFFIGLSKAPLLVAYDTGEILQRITGLITFSRNDSVSSNATSNNSSMMQS